MAQTDLGKWMITNGGDYDPATTYEQLTMVKYGPRTYITLKTVSGVTPTDDRVNYMILAQGFDAEALSSVSAVDTSGVAGTAGHHVNAQTLIDAIADRVMTKLLAKSQVVNNLLANVSGNVLDATQGKALKDQIDVLNNNIKDYFMTKELISVPYNAQPGKIVTVTNIPVPIVDGYRLLCVVPQKAQIDGANILWGRCAKTSETTCEFYLFNVSTSVIESKSTCIAVYVKK